MFDKGCHNCRNAELPGWIEPCLQCLEVEGFINWVHAPDFPEPSGKVLTVEDAAADVLGVPRPGDAPAWTASVPVGVASWANAMAEANREQAVSAPVAQPLTDEQIDRAVAAERDALLDHIYEHGTAAEGVIERVRKLARAAIEATGQEGGAA
jgi:hypothetical protein